MTYGRVLRAYQTQALAAAGVSHSAELVGGDFRYRA
jgi:hypothetical protein